MAAVVNSTEPTPPPQAASPAQISAVLGNDDILRQILLRLDFPTCLVRAAAVSKRWLRHASDPALLRRFARLHPPRLLGCFVKSSHFPLRFVPLPQPPELDAVIRRGSFNFGRGAWTVFDCRNGRLIVFVMPENGMPGEQTVFSPLHPERGTTVLRFPRISVQHDGSVSQFSSQFLFHDGGGDGMSVAAVTVMRSEQQAWVHIRDLQAGAWGEGRYSDLIQLPAKWFRCEKPPFLANGKLYLVRMSQYILGIDVASMSSTCIRVPDGVEFGYDPNFALSRAEGSGFCLVYARKFQMQVWRYSLDGSSIGNWELMDTICLRQVLGHLADFTWTSRGAGHTWTFSGVVVQVLAVGHNADFVFLRIRSKVFYLHISSKAVERVYELRQGECLFGFSPFMMVWPPTFPTLNGGCDTDE